MVSLTPDRNRDVLVEHIVGPCDGDSSHDRWVIFLGATKRGEAQSPQNALVFARLLSDLVKRPVWILHGSEEPQPVDTTSVRGCSCC